ncbi:unnamed protein product, partial [Timema podura]|nr:unnamed protein product [Timema podura]
MQLCVLTTTGIAATAVRCEDHNQHCERWATIGECANNPDYMNIYCAKACGACSGVFSSGGKQ